MPFLPKQAADSSIRRARRFLDLADASLPVTRVKSDLRRMAVVQAVAAIDSYMHALVLRRLADVRKESDLPRSLAKLELPFSTIADIAEEWIDHQRAQADCVQHSKPLIQKRPWVRVKRSLQDRLLKETFQSYDQIAVALSMAGVEKGWSKIGDELGQSPKQIKSWLSSLVHRRNQIVHEGDLQRQSRPHGLKFNKIAQNETVQQVDQVERLITAIEVVVN